MMARSWVNQNPPFDVEWAGFRSNSALLGRCGWKLAMRDDLRYDRVGVIFHHPEFRVTLEGEPTDTMRHRVMFDPPGRALVHIRHMYRGGDRISYHASSPFEGFSWRETDPMYVQMTEVEFHALPLFRELDKPVAQELIVDPADVGRILELVHKAQAPEQAAIRDRNRRRDERVQLHAHILSVAA